MLTVLVDVEVLEHVVGALRAAEDAVLDLLQDLLEVRLVGVDRGVAQERVLRVVELVLLLLVREDVLLLRDHVDRRPVARVQRLVLRRRRVLEFLLHARQPLSDVLAGGERERGRDFIVMRVPGERNLTRI